MHFSLKDLEISIHLGVPDEERNKLQVIRIDAEWDIETLKSATTDDIADTVDYFQVEQLIRHFPDQKMWHLLEKLHSDLKQTIKKKFTAIKNLKITITKYPFVNGSVSVSNA